MHTFEIAALAWILSIVPASGGFAQAHKAKHGGGAAHTPRAATPARAMTPANPPTGKVDVHPATGPRPSSRTDDELVASLHSTKAHLDQLHRDGRGHHARALSEVDHAIKLLGETPGSALSPTPPARPSQAPASPEAHLAEARKTLQEVESRMSTDGINAHRFIRARASVRTAIRELNLALVDR